MATPDIYTVLQQSLEAQRPLVYCRLVATHGSTPQKAGATMLVFSGGDQAGSLGGGCMEAEVRRSALQTLCRRPTARGDLAAWIMTTAGTTV